MYVFIMHIMRLIIFEEKAEIQDHYPLSLNRDRDRLQKYWANIPSRSLSLIQNIYNLKGLLQKLRRRSYRVIHEGTVHYMIDYHTLNVKKSK